MVIKKQKTPEYTLNIFRYLDEQTNTVSIIFLVQTVKEFTNFKYEILLNAGLKEKTFELNILGLRTTPLIMPGVGPATGRKEFPNVRGSYKLLITKLDGEENKFQLELTAQKITVKQAPPQMFISISTEPLPTTEH